VNVGKLKSTFALELLSELDGAIPEEFLGIKIHRDASGEKLLMEYWDGHHDRIDFNASHDDIRRYARRTAKKWIREKAGKGDRFSRFLKHFGVSE